MDQKAELFAKGLIEHYKPDLDKVKTQLLELNSKQDFLLKEMQGENLRFMDMKNTELEELFAMIKEHQVKLVAMKTNIRNTSVKSADLKKRAVKLQEYKQKIALENAHYREAQLRREINLVAKPDPSLRPL